MIRKKIKCVQLFYGLLLTTMGMLCCQIGAPTESWHVHVAGTTLIQSI